jgi:pyruvate dehydrogenase E2 component (dihydrolipoamide acetyltransferase)
MTRSLAEIPQIHLSRQMDVTLLARKQEGVTFTHRLIAASSAALAKHPALRSTLDGSRLRVHPADVAVALDTPHGLVAPVVRGAEGMGVAKIAETLTELRDRASRNGLRREEFANGPFAITNLGMYGIDFFSAFVFHGQTAVLAVGRAVESTNGRKTAWFSLALDHRVVDGAEGARFLETLQGEMLGESH